MKKIVSLIVLNLILINGLYAQNDLDVLRYSHPEIGGDSRFVSMAGSMGALGANLSCVNFNPAGIGLYRKGELNFSAGIQTTTSQSSYNNMVTNDFKTNLFLGSVGMAFAWEEESPFKDETSRKKFKDWSRRHVIGFTYNKLNQFHQNVTISGTAYQQSIMNDFLSAAQNYAPSELNPFYEGLAFNTYLIDTMPGTLTDYGTYFYLDKTFAHQKKISISGGINSYGINYAFALNNKHYFGASVGILSGKWNYESTFDETDAGDSTEYFKNLKFSETIQTQSLGINLKLGFISRLSEYFRAGAYFHTPSALSLTDAYSNRIEVNFDSLFGQRNVFLSDSSGAGNFKYSIKTPFRVGLSLAFIYKKYFSINVDAEYIDYKKGNISSKTYTFNEVNEGILKKYISAINYKIGFEWNISPFAVRLGYALYGAPFKNAVSNSNQIYTAGFGWKFKENRNFDIAFIYRNWKENYYLFNPEFVNISKLNFNRIVVQASYSIRF
jgi:hypothetical protein